MDVPQLGERIIADDVNTVLAAIYPPPRPTNCRASQPNPRVLLVGESVHVGGFLDAVQARQVATHGDARGDRICKR
eukprot:5000885-Prymnesium_polylepis.1